MIKKCIFALFAVGMLPLFGGNLLTNASFEETVPLKLMRWKVELVKDWDLHLNSGQKTCKISLIEPGSAGKKALRLQTLGKRGFSSATFSRKIDVKPGQQVSASVKMRGKGHGYIRIYLMDSKGKRLKHYKMLGRRATDKWESINLKFTVTPDIASISYSLQTLRDNADISFDEAYLSISRGDILENKNVRISFNPRIGGGIDSFIWKKSNFEVTSPLRLGKNGGMLNVIVPDNRLPGEFLYRTYKTLKLTDSQAVYSTFINSGKYKGLEIKKSYQLLPNGVKLTLSMHNTGKKDMTLTQRMQSNVSSARGVFSWPTPDWLTIFEQTGAPLSGRNSFVYDLFRAGWQARSYAAHKTALRISFDTGIARRLYSYLVMEPGFSTMECYLKEYKISPGKAKQFVFSVEMLPEKNTYYADAHGRKQRVETIKPIKMPPVPKDSGSSDSIKNFFCFSAGLGNLHQPELAGNFTNVGFSKQNIVLQKRLARILIDSYFNALSPSRFILEPILKEARRETGKNFLGEMARKYQFKIVGGHIFSLRSDLDPEKYMKEKWPAKKAMLENKEFQDFYRTYQDVIPLYWTGDELLPQNADVMLRVHQELKAYFPEHVSFFPYLNSSSTDLLPYLPVFLGDWYPIKRKWSSGRNPWNVYPEFSRIRKIAGDKPVWFMPQGFSGGPDNRDGIYAFPTAGEVRLMLHLSVAAGVRGIAWHGFSSGTWPWMMCYHMYRYSMLGAGGQISPTWEGVVDCAKQFSAVSPLLLKADPAAVPASVKFTTGDYRSFNGFYEGPAVKLYALKMAKGMIYIAINQDPYSPRRAEILLPPGKNWDLTALTPLRKRSVKLDLAPGGAVYFGCGISDKDIDEVFTSRFRAERARYLLLAEKAGSGGIKAVDPDSFKKNPPRKALALLLKEYAALQKRIDAAPLGRIMKEMSALQSKMDAMDFRLCCAMELVVTKDMWKKTRKYARWTAHPDASYEKLRQRFARIFARFYRIQDAIWQGKGIGNAEKELKEIRKEADVVISGLSAWLDNHPQKELIDDPYAERERNKK